MKFQWRGRLCFQGRGPVGRLKNLGTRGTVIRVQARASWGTGSSSRLGSYCIFPVIFSIPASRWAEASVVIEEAVSQQRTCRLSGWFIGGYWIVCALLFTDGFYLGVKDRQLLAVLGEVLKSSRTCYLWSFSEHVIQILIKSFPLSQLFGTGEQCDTCV